MPLPFLTVGTPHFYVPLFGRGGPPAGLLCVFSLGKSWWDGNMPTPNYYFALGTRAFLDTIFVLRAFLVQDQRLTEEYFTASTEEGDLTY